MDKKQTVAHVKVASLKLGVADLWTEATEAQQDAALAGVREMRAWDAHDKAVKASTEARQRARLTWDAARTANAKLAEKKLGI